MKLVLDTQRDVALLVPQLPNNTDTIFVTRPIQLLATKLLFIVLCCNFGLVGPMVQGFVMMMRRRLFQLCCWVRSRCSIFDVLLHMRQGQDIYSI